MEPKTIYIAGKMTGVPLFNFPAFDAARDVLEAEGWKVISPADLDREVGFDPLNETFVSKDFLDRAMRRDIEALLTCDAIYMLEGWETSTGAKAELALANWRHIPVFYEKPPISEDHRNPKDILGSKKCPMHLLPPVALQATAWAHGQGATRYGPYNWRSKPIGASQYVGAILRHLTAWFEGEDNNPDSGINHLAHIGATVNILMDAGSHGSLIDDRPGRL